MKKLMLFVMAAFMVVGLAGTAGATDYTWTLNSSASIFASPVTEAGTSIYVLSGGPTGPGNSGVSLIAINPTTGTSLTLLNGAGGSSAYATPAVKSGETVYVQTVNPTLSGTSIFAMDGTASGTSFFTVQSSYNVLSGISLSAFPRGGTTSAYTPSLALSGSSIFAASQPLSTGVSIFAINTATGAVDGQYGTGVSAVYASPAVSGNSLFVLGAHGQGVGGVSLFAFNASAFTVAQRVNVLTGTAGVPFPTPAISGNSLFVVDAVGGLTAYNKNTLAVGAQDFIQYAVAANSSVTASPVTDGSFLVVSNNQTNGQAGITVFTLSSPLAGSTGASWWFTWAGTTITATPAISNGVLYVAVYDGTGGTIDRFNLSGHSGKLTAPDYTSITLDSRGRNLGFFEYSSPIIKSDRLIVVTNGGTGAAGAAAAATPVLYNFDVSGSNANGNAYWPQFKFDAEKKGANTAAAAAATPAAVADDDSGCFISTIK